MLLIFAFVTNILTDHVFGQSGQIQNSNLADFCENFDAATHACAEHYPTTQLLNPSRQDYKTKSTSIYTLYYIGT